MKKSACFPLIVWVIFITFTCSKKINQSGLKPAKVVLIPVVADTSRIEKGLDTVPERDAIRIEWILNSDERVIGYEIYRKSGESNSKFVKLFTAAETDSFYEDIVPQIGVRYYYTVLAVNDEDLRSESGDTLSYMLLQKASNLKPKGESSEGKPVFSWTDGNQAHEYVLRIAENATNRFVWVAVIQADYGNPIQSVVFNADQKASYSALIQGTDYRWRVDVRGQNFSGSESEWVTLKIR